MLELVIFTENKVQPRRLRDLDGVGDRTSSKEGGQRWNESMTGRSRCQLISCIDLSGVKFHRNTDFSPSNHVAKFGV
jgi:hypothetical protein